MAWAPLTTAPATGALLDARATRRVSSAAAGTPKGASTSALWATHSGPPASRTAPPAAPETAPAAISTAGADRAVSALKAVCAAPPTMPPAACKPRAARVTGIIAPAALPAPCIALSIVPWGAPSETFAPMARIPEASPSTAEPVCIPTLPQTGASNGFTKSTKPPTELAMPRLTRPMISGFRRGELAADCKRRISWANMRASFAAWVSPCCARASAFMKASCSLSISLISSSSGVQRLRGEFRQALGRRTGLHSPATARLAALPGGKEASGAAPG